MGLATCFLDPALSERQLTHEMTEKKVRWFTSPQASRCGTIARSLQGASAMGAHPPAPRWAEGETAVTRSVGSCADPHGGGDEKGDPVAVPSERTQTVTIYDDHPRAKVGWFLGLSGWQLGTVSASTLPVFASIQRQSWRSALVFLAVWAAISAIVIVPVRGRSAVGWCTAMLGYAVGGPRRPNSDPCRSRPRASSRPR